MKDDLMDKLINASVKIRQSESELRSLEDAELKINRLKNEIINSQNVIKHVLKQANNDVSNLPVVFYYSNPHIVLYNNDPFHVNSEGEIEYINPYKFCFKDAPEQLLYECNEYTHTGDIIAKGRDVEECSNYPDYWEWDDEREEYVINFNGRIKIFKEHILRKLNTTTFILTYEYMINLLDKLFPEEK